MPLPRLGCGGPTHVDQNQFVHQGSPEHHIGKGIHMALLSRKPCPDVHTGWSHSEMQSNIQDSSHNALPRPCAGCGSFSPVGGPQSESAEHQQPENALGSQPRQALPTCHQPEIKVEGITKVPKPTSAPTVPVSPPMPQAMPLPRLGCGGPTQRTDVYSAGLSGRSSSKPSSIIRTSGGPFSPHHPTGFFVEPATKLNEIGIRDVIPPQSGCTDVGGYPDGKTDMRTVAPVTMPTQDLPLEQHPQQNTFFSAKDSHHMPMKPGFESFRSAAVFDAQIPCVPTAHASDSQQQLHVQPGQVPQPADHHREALQQQENTSSLSKACVMSEPSEHSHVPTEDPPVSHAVPLPRLGCGGPDQQMPVALEDPGGLQVKTEKADFVSVSMPPVQGVSECLAPSKGIEALHSFPHADFPNPPGAMPLPRLGCGGPSQNVEVARPDLLDRDPSSTQQDSDGEWEQRLIQACQAIESQTDSFHRGCVPGFRTGTKRSGAPADSADAKRLKPENPGAISSCSSEHPVRSDPDAPNAVANDITQQPDLKIEVYVIAHNGLPEVMTVPYGQTAGQLLVAHAKASDQAETDLAINTAMASQIPLAQPLDPGAVVHIEHVKQVTRMSCQVHLPKESRTCPQLSNASREQLLWQQQGWVALDEMKFYMQMLCNIATQANFVTQLSSTAMNPKPSSNKLLI